MVLAPEMACQSGCYVRVIQRGFPYPVAVRKGNRVGPHRLPVSLRHHGNDTRRIQTCTQKGTDRHVADHLCFDRSSEPLANLVFQIGFRTRELEAVVWKLEVPILNYFYFFVTEQRIMAGRN